MRHDKQRSGFSLVELMMALFAASILAITAGILLSSGVTHTIRLRDEVDLQRDLTAAWQTIRSVVRTASSAQFHTASNRLDIVGLSGFSAIYRDGNSLRFLTPNGNVVTLIRPPALVAFSAAATGGVVTVGITVRGQGGDTALSATTACRN